MASRWPAMLSVLQTMMFLRLLLLQAMMPIEVVHHRTRKNSCSNAGASRRYTRKEQEGLRRWEEMSRSPVVGVRGGRRAGEHLKIAASSSCCRWLKRSDPL